MNKIPTAGEFIDLHYNEGLQTSDFMIEFAKLHVEAALNIASENYAQGSLTPLKGVSVKESILTAYPLDNIK